MDGTISQLGIVTITL